MAIPIRRVQSFSWFVSSLVYCFVFFKKIGRCSTSCRFVHLLLRREIWLRARNAFKSILSSSRSMGASFQCIAQRSKVLFVYSSGPAHSFLRLLSITIFLEMLKIAEYCYMSQDMSNTVLFDLLHQKLS